MSGHLADLLAYLVFIPLALLAIGALSLALAIPVISRMDSSPAELPGLVYDLDGQVVAYRAMLVKVTKRPGRPARPEYFSPVQGTAWRWSELDGWYLEVDDPTQIVDGAHYGVHAAKQPDDGEVRSIARGSLLAPLVFWLGRRMGQVWLSQIVEVRLSGRVLHQAYGYLAERAEITRVVSSRRL